jgi:hypothetical protein
MRPGLKITRFYEENEVIVSGTADIDVARAEALAGVRADLEEDGWDGEELVEQLRQLDDLQPRVGWYRWNPCNERSCYDGGGHKGHLGYCDGPGRGRWQGVYFHRVWAHAASVSR